MAATTLTDRTLLRLSGDDVRGFLQGLVTSDVSGSLPVWAGLLTPQGKCLFDFLVWSHADATEDLLIDCEAAAADALAKRIGMYRLRRPITIEPETRLVVHWAANDEDGMPDPRLPALGRRWLAPASNDGEINEEWRTHRLRMGVCEGMAELGDLLWLECNAVELNGVSFTKGCFVGQENTARMNWRSKVNRRLVVVEGDGGERARTTYPDLGLSVVHARIDAIPQGAIIPDWLAKSLAA
ncbi:MAG: folate-binding protein [Sphingomicrobium sp.]